MHAAVYSSICSVCVTTPVEPSDINQQHSVSPAPDKNCSFQKGQRWQAQIFERNVRTSWYSTHSSWKYFEPLPLLE